MIRKIFIIMGWIFVDKDESEGGKMRQQMRHNMRGGGYRQGYGMSGYRTEYDRGYRQGYNHGWEDYEDDDMEYRRGRDSRGRYV